MNTLLQDQNTEPFVRLLRAQRIAYNVAKKYLIVDFISILIALSPTILFLINFKEVEPNEVSGMTKATAVIAVIGVIWTLLSIFAQTLMDRQTKVGAIIQDQFDTLLFNLDRNNILIESEIEISHIVELSEKYKKDDLTDWYSINIPTDIENDASVLLAYKCNAIYGKSLRKKYIYFIQFALFLYYGALICISLKNNTGTFDFVLLLAPSIPALVFATLTIKAQKGIINTYDKINILVEQMFNEYKNNKLIPSKVKLRQIQDLFYIQRMVSNKVPTWFYRLFKVKTEELVNKSIEIMTKE
jgi:hypothetical protein